MRKGRREIFWSKSERINRLDGSSETKKRNETSVQEVKLFQDFRPWNDGHYLSFGTPSIFFSLIFPSVFSPIFPHFSYSSFSNTFLTLSPSLSPTFLPFWAQCQGRPLENYWIKPSTQHAFTRLVLPSVHVLRGTRNERSTILSLPLFLPFLSLFLLFSSLSLSLLSQFHLLVNEK